VHARACSCLCVYVPARAIEHARAYACVRSPWLDACLQMCATTDVCMQFSTPIRVAVNPLSRMRKAHSGLRCIYNMVLPVLVHKFVDTAANV